MFCWSLFYSATETPAATNYVQDKLQNYLGHNDENEVAHWKKIRAFIPEEVGDN